ncbi:MAG: hypothetical protein RBR69_07080 [Candidatus Cloacimonadaceae bacterium]|jgi:hypothetical protein|nr:hypothetical protein [Candidatus Cloacimonadota bacterium]MDY0127875.1 hypothetical protein [Candidatus Cloacimonadaceae bacterium]MCB5254263.1 hypothetical protein [Candidatus Cloacimonadota bacterium]MCK9178302.1 hypothetical protein [Candidatus Cloacimonadota bacterium]MCK9242536.1 hypothetical protein [Candidatus Cloacimonadota bacterium]
MKKLLFLLCLCLGLSSLLAMPSAKSIFYADSYMLRAYGVEANYWNPAKLSKDRPLDVWLPLVNSAIYASNNALDLDTYNYFASRDTLHSADKIKLLDLIDGRLRVRSGGSISVFGITTGNAALSASTKHYLKGALSEKYLNILLYGNTDDSYEFVKSNTNVSALAYTDFTYGLGDFTLPFIPEPAPQVKAGFSVSLLTGLYSIDTQEYSGYITNNPDEGMNALQEIKLRQGMGGIGFKGMLGVYSELLPGLQAGLTVDNIAGFINWRLKSQEDSYTFSVDSLYVSNIGQDFYLQESESYDIDPFTTTMPAELRLAAMYKHKYATVSADWVHGFKDTATNSATGVLSLAASFQPIKNVDLSWGVSLPNSHNPLKVSYGVNFKDRFIDFGLALQSYDSAFPGYKSKGVSLGLSMGMGF